MLITNAKELRNFVQREGRIAALDIGEKTVGTALSDPSLMIATGQFTLKRDKFEPLAKQLLAFFNERNVQAIVVGYPINMNGTEGPMCQSIRQFITNMETHTNLPFCLWDERLTTASAFITMKESGTPAKKKSKLKDQIAAAIILQSFLDFCALP